MQIKSKFGGKCRGCSEYHDAGDTVYWEKGVKGVLCLGCAPIEPVAPSIKRLWQRYVDGAVRGVPAPAPDVLCASISGYWKYAAGRRGATPSSILREIRERLSTREEYSVWCAQPWFDKFLAMRNAELIAHKDNWGRVGLVTKAEGGLGRQL